MSANTEQRKLAAIMFTDMVSYGALAQGNEALALELLTVHHRFLRTLFPKFGGREIKPTGDVFLVEFSSASSTTPTSSVPFSLRAPTVRNYRQSRGFRPTLNVCKKHGSNGTRASRLSSLATKVPL